MSPDLPDTVCGRDLPGLFETVDRLLVPDGIAVTRSITVPEETDPS